MDDDHQIKNIIQKKKKPSTRPSNKNSFFSSLKRDWTLLFKSFRFKAFKKRGELEEYSFVEPNTLGFYQARLQQLSEAKRTLNQRIEKIQKQLELLDITLKGQSEDSVRYQLIKDGQRASHELQIVELEIQTLRREQKKLAATIPTSAAPDLLAR